VGKGAQSYVYFGTFFLALLVSTGQLNQELFDGGRKADIKMLYIHTSYEISIEYIISNTNCLQYSVCTVCSSLKRSHPSCEMKLAHWLISLLSDLCPLELKFVTNTKQTREKLYK
jgi:hypothetical protein